MKRTVCGFKSFLRKGKLAFYNLIEVPPYKGRKGGKARLSLDTTQPCGVGGKKECTAAPPEHSLPVSICPHWHHTP